MKLAAKLMLVFLAVVILMTAVGSYFSVRRGFEQFQQHQEDMAKETAHAIDKQLAEAWQQGGLDSLLSAMDGLRLPGSTHSLRWVWFERTQLADGRAQTAVIEHLNLDGGRVVSTTVTDQFGRRHLQTYHPIDLGSGPRGGLEFSDSLESQDAQTRATIIMALISIGVIALSSLGFVYLAGIYWVAKPLDRLIDKTHRIAQGDFTRPLPESGHDELSMLARALNDMSEQLAAQQQRIRDESAARLETLEQLRHADRLKTVGRLAAGLAHELGTPLNVMSGRAGLIASGKLTSEEITASARTIRGEAERVTRLIRQLLDFARPGKSPHVRFDVSRLLRETADLLEPIVEKRNVRIEIIPSPETTISADRGQIQQVLTNIIVNAAQAMPAGGTVSVSLQQCEKHRACRESELRCRFVGMAIRDQGVGIPSANHEQIFEPFFTTKNVGEGTGLGLSIAWGIVQEHGGWIDIESEPGRGSCFTVWIPGE